MKAVVAALLNVKRDRAHCNGAIFRRIGESAMAKNELKTADMAALGELLEFPLLKAMFGRRSRRFGMGMTIPDGSLAYESKLAPLPLNDLERALLSF